MRCRECRLDFSSKRNILRHRANGTCPRIIIHALQCPFCTEAYPRRNLLQHVRIFQKILPAPEKAGVNSETWKRRKGRKQRLRQCSKWRKGRKQRLRQCSKWRKGRKQRHRQCRKRRKGRKQRHRQCRQWLQWCEQWRRLWFQWRKGRK